jgi:Tfp pilus assembly protein FimV
MARETQGEILAQIEERTRVLPEINKHLEKLNDSISQTNIKLAKTNAIAEAADRKADANRRYIDKASIAIGVSIITALGAIISVIIILI